MQATESTRAIIRGSEPPPDFARAKSLVKDLKAGFEFSTARNLIEFVRGAHVGEEHRWLTQQLALCTYKDEELLPAARFRRALALLTEIGLRQPAMLDPETLGLGGAVYKRKFEFAGQLEDLHESLALYRAGWERRPDDELYKQERPYCAVNAAYILDLLASRALTIARQTGTSEAPAATYAAQARDVREQILRYAAAMQIDLATPAGTNWDAVTWAEAFFGLGDYERAGAWLAFARSCQPSEWEQQTTWKQLVAIARLHGVEAPLEGSPPDSWHPAWQALHRFLDGDAETAFSCYRGKVGLALSGGGFRASLFHIGVLARLAEMDVLRSVEVLSTVSGGSIVGAHYYLEVQRLLEAQPDRQIRRHDYVAIVRRVQRTFFRGVRRNLRMRALADPWNALQMMLSRGYSRSNRIGELYEEELYRHVRDGRESDPRLMANLQVRPQPQPAPALFKPKFSNWRRRAKVPALLLNATSLNSGHNWQFTARWMGEPPGLFSADIDANVRYRRLWYEQAPTPALQQYRVGHAVAASACVPGLFDPLVLPGLYPGRTVRLVDGGVHDNQGVGGLLDESCTLLLCSDASGQMADLERPPDTFLGVPLRANGILQDRVREAQCLDLDARLENRAVEGLFFIHLKQGLSVAALDWVGCKDPTPVPPRSLSTTDYGIDRDVQRHLAAMRTDLDSFSEVEAYALMASGYLMTEHQFRELQKAHTQAGKPGQWGNFDVDVARGKWAFLRLADLMRLPADSADRRRHDLETQLRAGSGLFFKAWKLVPALNTIALLAGGALALLLGATLCHTWGAHIPPFDPHLTVGGAVLMAAVTIGAFLWPILKWLNPQSALRGYLARIAIAIGGCVASNVHLRVIDPLFLARGRVRRLLRLP